MWLFVGLGNPGAKYDNNRHNVGFMVIDKIQDNKPSFGSFRSKFQGKLSEGRLSGQKVVLLKPTTYMNNSGQSVAKVSKFYKIPSENIVVFHDELDIKAGDIRVKQGGSNAGHNGLRSIQAHLGTSDFWRVRIGIGRPHPNADISGYVLDNFLKEERIWLEPLINAFVDDMEDLFYIPVPDEVFREWLVSNFLESFENFLKERFGISKVAVKVVSSDGTL